MHQQRTTSQGSRQSRVVYFSSLAERAKLPARYANYADLDSQSFRIEYRRLTDSERNGRSKLNRYSKWTDVGGAFRNGVPAIGRTVLPPHFFRAHDARKEALLAANVQLAVHHRNRGD